ncbi:MAG TPA: ABC transporter permease [Candidatus Limnocylindrales bacterium]|nr:ABC transporter permease [Candidatus Limnocylindrales bacterium]
MGLLKSVMRTLALVGKELVEVMRRPGAILSLVLGPFLVLAVFGLGYQGVKADLRTVVVVPADSGLPTDASAYEAFTARGVRIVEVATDEAGARALLENEEVDLLVIIPADAQARLEAGEQSELRVVMNQTDPVQSNYAGFLAETLAAEVNRELYRRAADEGRGYAISVGGEDLGDIPPEVIASPVTASTENIAPTTPGIIPYFGPAALALVLQHMAVALVALSVVRERRSGAMDLFRIAPVRSVELILGKVLAYGFLGAVIAASSVALLVGVLGVPLLGQLGLVAGVIGLLLLASLGLGLLISIVSDSERQAVQLSLLVLLASMFFSGFVLRIGEFNEPVQVAARALPVTHGIALLQDLLLRGEILRLWQVGALAAIAGVLLLASWGLLRREMRPA